MSCTKMSALDSYTFKQVLNYWEIIRDMMPKVSTFGYSCCTWQIYQPGNKLLQLNGAITS